MNPPPPSTLLQLPLFPLRSVLFPGGSLPLQIFEVRYLDMIGRCHKAGDLFGVVCLSEGSEVRRRAPGDGFAPEAFFPIGTLARIVELQRPQPGLMIARCVGTQRFRVRHSAQEKYGLWVGEVEVLGDEAVVPVPDDLAFARDALQNLLHNIEQSIEHSGEAGVELPLREPYQWDDCAWLANRWCEMLPLKAELKQRLLALDSPVLRLELVADTLGQMGLTRAPR
jgi:uncharacterized protein